MMPITTFLDISHLSSGRIFGSDKTFPGER